jgi:hypothetical protein
MRNIVSNARMSERVAVHRFPHGCASGWYQVGWSGGFAPGAVDREAAAWPAPPMLPETATLEVDFSPVLPHTCEVWSGLRFPPQVARPGTAARRRISAMCTVWPPSPTWRSGPPASTRSHEFPRHLRRPRTDHMGHPEGAGRGTYCDDPSRNGACRSTRACGLGGQVFTPRESA